MFHYNLPAVNMLQYGQIDEAAFERSIAHTYYDRALRKGWLKRARARFTGESRRLLSLAALQSGDKSAEQHYIGLQTVLLNRIRGSENRTMEFDTEFYPLKEHTEQRWVRVATAFLRGVKLPPVELIKAGDVYYVRDGHHRISVARFFEQTEIDAVVVERSVV